MILGKSIATPHMVCFCAEDSQDETDNDGGECDDDCGECDGDCGECDGDCGECDDDDDRGESDDDGSDHYCTRVCFHASHWTGPPCISSSLHTTLDHS